MSPIEQPVDQAHLPFLDAPVVAMVQRSDFVESVHRGVVVATEPDGSIAWSRGDVGRPIFPRSANKPLQAVAMVRSGLRLPPELLALVCASHSGSQRHRDGVQEILATAGLEVGALANTPALPLGEAEQHEWLRAGGQATSLTQNCSGKHAGMLATCQHTGWSVADYLAPEHPLQRAMSEVIAELTAEPVAAIGVDGCGAPVAAVSPVGLARAFGRLAAAAHDSAEGQVAAAIRAYPEQVGGHGRDITNLLQAVPGAVAKDGAEAVYAIGMPDGRGLAVKIADGGVRAASVVAAAALRQMGIETAELKSLLASPVLGYGKQVGFTSAVGFDGVGAS